MVNVLLEPEPSRVRKRRAAEIQAQNQALADDLFQQLETARYKDVWVSIAIPTAYLRLKEADAYPCDHLLEVLERDGRMQWTGAEIHYADWNSPFDRTFNDLSGEPKQTLSTRQKPLSTFACFASYMIESGVTASVLCRKRSDAVSLAIILCGPQSTLNFS